MNTATTSLPIQREVDVYIAMAYGRDRASSLGFSPIERTKIEIIILELARNILNHAGGSGDLRIAVVERAGQRGLCITARDDGPGIVDVSRAMQDGFSTAGTLGAGLPGVQRLADTFTIESQPGHGTTVKAWKWISDTQRGRL
jgi:serine/threonine-protein kinase RsbT